jgi:uncharacterized phage protein (TIGR02220 family)
VVHYQATINTVIDYLNLRAAKSYSPTSEQTKKLIKARLSDGMTEQQLKVVIDNKVKAWKDDPKMEMYLRPVTLFGSKCESYYNERDLEADAFSELDQFMSNKG